MDIRNTFANFFALLALSLLLSGCAQDKSQESGQTGTNPEAGQAEDTETPSGGAPSEADPTKQPQASAEGEAPAAPKADEEEDASAPGPDPLIKRYADQMAAAKPLLENFRKEILTNVSTNSQKLEDTEVAPSQLDPWAGELTDYEGKFIGPLDAELREVIFTHRSREDHPDYLAAEMIYQREEVTATGMMEPVKGRVDIPFTKVKGSVIVWPKQSDVKARVGQFVSWPGSKGNTQQGLLIHSPDNANEPFTLLRKSSQ